MSPQEYYESFAPIMDKLKEIPHQAWGDLMGWIPESERGDMFLIPRAGFVQWRMIVHAQNTFGTNGPIRVVKDDDGLSFLYMLNDGNPVAFEFGKADDTMCRRKNQNGKNRQSLDQMVLWHYETEPKRFNLVYTVGGYGLSAHIDRVILTLEGQDGVEWFKVLSRSEEKGDDFGIAVRPVDPTDGPPAPKVLPKMPVKDNKKHHGQKRAGNAD